MNENRKRQQVVKRNQNEIVSEKSALPLPFSNFVERLLIVGFVKQIQQRVEKGRKNGKLVHNVCYKLRRTALQLVLAFCKQRIHFLLRKAFDEQLIIDVSRDQIVQIEVYHAIVQLPSFHNSILQNNKAAHIRTLSSSVISTMLLMKTDL